MPHFPGEWSGPQGRGEAPTARVDSGGFMDTFRQRRQVSTGARHGRVVVAAPRGQESHLYLLGRRPTTVGVRGGLAFACSPCASLRHEATASGRVTRRASSDPACPRPSAPIGSSSRGSTRSGRVRSAADGGANGDGMSLGMSLGQRVGMATSCGSARPRRGPPSVTGPLGGAILIPRPLAEEPHSLAVGIGDRVTHGHEPPQ